MSHIKLYAPLTVLAGALLIAAGGVLLGGSQSGPDGALESGPPLSEHPESVPRMEWDNPCPDFYADVLAGVDAEILAARYGLDADATVPGLGVITGFGCMSGSETGISAIHLSRRVGDDLYVDYLIADGGEGYPWADWFAATQPDIEFRPIEYGWTSEPTDLSNGIPDQPVWERLPDVLEKVEG